MTRTTFDGTTGNSFKVGNLTIESSNLTQERTFTIPDSDIDISQIETNVVTVSGDLSDVDGRVTVNESDIVDLQTDKLDKSGGTITGSLTINENLYVNGTETIVNTESISAKDNLIVINAGEGAAGVTAGEAGIEVDRGSEPFYHFKFVESTETFVVGLSGEYQAVATREDSPTPGRVAIWDGSGKFVTTGNASVDGTLTATSLSADSITVGDVSNTEFSYLDGVTSSIQSQLNGKLDKSGGTITNNLTIQGTVTINEACVGTYKTLTSSSSITPDFSSGNYFNLTLGVNTTLQNPTGINPSAGQSGVIAITQDGSGNRTMAFGSYWKFAGGSVPTLSTTAGATDLLCWQVISSNFIVATLLGDVS